MKNRQLKALANTAAKIMDIPESQKLTRTREILSNMGAQPTIARLKKWAGGTTADLYATLDRGYVAASPHEVILGLQGENICRARCPTLDEYDKVGESVFERW